MAKHPKKNVRKEVRGVSGKSKAPLTRKNKIFDLNIISKPQVLEEQGRMTKCPPIKRKEKFCWADPDSTITLTPIGIKGKLSDSYVPTDQLYVHQMYSTIQKIGKGTYGYVYKAYCIETRKMCALKVIKRYDPVYKYSEIERLDKVIDNPNSVQYRNAWEEKGAVYIEFDLYPMSLQNFGAKKVVTEEECWDILFDMTEALIPIHKQGMCHMDIKPDNIMVSSDGFFKLADFGLLSDVDITNGRKQHSEGDSKYIATEVLAGNASAAGDVYALGISLLELAMDLILPSYGQKWHDIRECSSRKLPDDKKPLISSELEFIINWMMEAAPGDRPTMEEIYNFPKITQLRRSRKPRVNHYENWCQTVDDQQINVTPDGAIPVIDISSDSEDDVAQQRPNGTPFRISASRVVPDTEMDLEFKVPLSSLSTPPRRVSSVILYETAHKRVGGLVFED